MLLILACVFSLSINANHQVDAIHVKVSGKGAPIILIPGFTVPGDIYTPLVNELANTYECHVVSLAGFAGNDPIDFPWLPKVNETIKAYIVKNKLQNATIIGHSLGGTIATWLASCEDLQLSKIILIDALPAAGALMMPNFNPDHLTYDSPFNTQQLNMTEQEFEQMATSMSKGMSRKATGQEQIKKWMLQADRKTYVYGYTDYLKLDLRADLKKIAIPVTILAASAPYGKEMATQTYKSQYENLNKYELIIAEDSAHFIMLDKPKWFLDQIQQILSTPND